MYIWLKLIKKGIDIFSSATHIKDLIQFFYISIPFQLNKLTISLSYWHIYSPTFKFTSLVFINFYIPFLPSWWISKIFSSNPFLCTQTLGYWFLNMNNWCAGRSPSREWPASVLFSSLSWIIKYSTENDVPMLCLFWHWFQFQNMYANF